MEVKANVSFRAARLPASTRVGAAVAMAGPSKFSAKWVRVPNSRRLPLMRWGRVRDLAPRNQGVDLAWFVRTDSALSRNAQTVGLPALQGRNRFWS